MDIRQLIESRIKAAGITKKELAERMGAHPGSLNSMLEAPSWPTLERVARALDIEVPDLFAPVSSTFHRCPHCGAEIKIELK